MKGRERLALLLVLLLGGWCALLAVRVASHDRDARAELGRFKLTQLEPATRARLDALHDEVLLTLYVSERASLPSSMRTLERDVTDLAATLREASGGRVAFQVADPAADEDLAHYAATAGAAPIRVRSVERDGYSEKIVWSALTIAYGSHPPVTINGLLPERLPRLQALLVAELDQMEAPRRPVLALAAPAGYDELAAALAARGDVQRVDLDGGAAFPERADLLLWMDPQRVDSARVRELELFLASGRSVLVAGSAHELAEPVAADAHGEPVLTFRETGVATGALLSGFGLFEVPGVACDQWVEGIDVAGRQVGVPCVFRSIAPDQDFHTFRGQPNGHLRFSVPTPFRLDAARLGARGLSAELLASSSDGTWIVPQPTGPVPVAQLAPEHGQLAPRQPLLVALRPTDPWGGLLVASAASTPFRDGLLHRPGYAHDVLLAVLLDGLVNDARLVQSRVGLDRPAPLPELSATARAVWRGVCVLLFPVAVLLVGLLVARRRRTRLASAPARTTPAPAATTATTATAATPAATTATATAAAPGTRGWRGRAALLGCGAALVALLIVQLARSTGAQADLTQDQLNELSPTTAALAARATGAGALVAELWFSPRDRLPPALRPGLARLTDMLGELRRAGASLDVQVMLPEDLDAAGRQALAAQGIAPVDVTTRDDEVTSVRTVWCSLRLRRATGATAASTHSTVLSFADPASFEPLEFRLAFALWRLETGRSPLVGFASDAPRLSAAEAHDLYQKRGLIPPQGSDAYALARAAVESWDFRVVHVNPREGELMPERTAGGDGLDALLWIQPRRPAGEMLQQTAEYLHGGGKVLLAAQHFAMQSRQFPGLAFKLQYWPQPQSTDLETMYLPDLGIDLVREPLFDELMAALPLTSMVYEGQSRDVSTMDAALPFFLRVPSANQDAASPVMRHVGDQVLPFASAVRVDDEVLAAHGLHARVLMTTSPHAWSLAWAGGAIPDDLIAGPPRDGDGAQVWRGRLPLAVEVTGQFPLPEKRLAAVAELHDEHGEPLAEQPPQPPYPPADLPPAAPGRLLLLGDSELFKNQRMLDPDFRADHLLLNAVASLALPPELAEVATRRAVARGFELLDPSLRLRWRALVLGGFPLLALAFGGCWTLLRRRRPAARRAASRGTSGGGASGDADGGASP